MKISLIVVFVVLAMFSHARQPVSSYAEDLRVQNEKAQAVSSEETGLE